MSIPCLFVGAPAPIDATCQGSCQQLTWVRVWGWAGMRWDQPIDEGAATTLRAVEEANLRTTAAATQACRAAEVIYVPPVRTRAQPCASEAHSHAPRRGWMRAARCDGAAASCQPRARAGRPVAATSSRSACAAGSRGEIDGGRPHCAAGGSPAPNAGGAGGRDQISGGRWRRRRRRDAGAGA
jgi:hypothetical protein